MPGVISHKISGMATRNMKSPGSKMVTSTLTGKRPSMMKGKKITHGLVKKSIMSTPAKGMRKLMFHARPMRRGGR